MSAVPPTQTQQQKQSQRPLRILLVNDDGPPASHSPHILGLYQALVARGHKVSVVIPCSQRSWGAMAFSISGEAGVWWYYPREGDHMDKTIGERWETRPRPIKVGEIGEWVLVDGSPTTCANVGLFNQSITNPGSEKHQAFDLVLSGPNFGRNTGAAFCLSSGTLGAALAASMSNIKAIALSYGHFAVVPKAIQQKIDERNQRNAATTAKQTSSDPAQKTALQQEKKEHDSKTATLSNAPSSPRPAANSKPQAWKNVAPVAPQELVQIAHNLSIDIVERLYEEWDPTIGVYNVNVPLAWTIKEPQVYWTTTWRNKYPQLFKPVPIESDDSAAAHKEASQASANKAAQAPTPRTKIIFQPEISSMMTQGSDKDLAGTDTWALMNGHVSVTPLRAGFIEPEMSAQSGQAEPKRWRL